MGSISHLVAKGPTEALLWSKLFTAIRPNKIHALQVMKVVQMIKVNIAKGTTDPRVEFILQVPYKS